MDGAAPPRVLRPGLLAEVSVLGAGPPAAGPLEAATAAACGRLGATVRRVAVDPAGDGAPVPALDGRAVVVWDGDAAFDASSDGDVRAVHAALDGAWLVVGPAAGAGLTSHGGKVVLLAPRPGTAHREAARSGLENLARTLGIEWARHGVRTTAVLPGPATEPAAVGELVAYLASRAGDYFSGCALTLGGSWPQVRG